MKRQTAAHTAIATAMHIAKAAFLPFTRGGGGVALVALVLTLAACNSGGGSSNNTTPKTPSAKAELLSLKISDGDTDHTVDITGDTGEVRDVPQGKTLRIGEITISSGATAKITTADTSSDAEKGEPITLNSNNEFSITITAEDKKTTQTYTITVLAPSDEAQLIALRIAGKAVEFVDTTGTITLLYGTVLANVTIDRISLSDGATADFSDGAEAKAGATIPVSGKQFTITVTAEDGTTTADYSITIQNDPTLTVASHYQDRQRIGAGDFEKTDLLQIGNVQNGEWSYAISVTGSDENNAALTLPNQTQTATASDSSFDTNPLTADQWNMFRDTSPDNLLLTIDITLWRSGEDKPTAPTGSLGSIAKEQYLLKSWQDVQAIHHDLAGSYTLMHDITFPEPDTDGMTAAGFEPIGEHKTNGNSIAFTGSINGNDHTLHNLFINRASTEGVGLVAVLGTDASIDSLSLVLHADGIRGHQTIGALVGYNYGSISHSDVSGDVRGNSNTGGLVGITIGGSISHSYASGSVHVDELAVGGLVGISQSNISHSYASGSVSATLHTAGGLVGQNSGGGNISHSYASGHVAASDGNVGGLVGYDDGSITNSYASGAVAGTGSLFGGLVGGGSGSTVTNSYWDTQTTGQTRSVGGTGKSTTEMYMQAIFDKDGDNTSDWDFDAIWCINEGNDYPRLRGVGGQDLTNCE